MGIRMMSQRLSSFLSSLLSILACSEVTAIRVILQHFTGCGYFKSFAYSLLSLLHKKIVGLSDFQLSDY
jgi:hypothetical protein